MPNTGPRTAQGKAAVSLNGVKHGLRTMALVIPSLETEEEWGTFQASVLESMVPRGAVEGTLSARIAETLWRLRRVSRAERDIVAAAHDRADALDASDREARDSDRGEIEAAGFYASVLAAPRLPRARSVLPDPSSLDQIIRYEAHLNRQLYQAMHELEVLQDRRKGRATPLARVQVHGLPGV